MIVKVVTPLKPWLIRQESAGSSHLPPSENSPAAVWHPATHRPRSEEPTGLFPHITAAHCSPGHKVHSKTKEIKTRLVLGAFIYPLQSQFHARVCQLIRSPEPRMSSAVSVRARQTSSLGLNSAAAPGSLLKFASPILTIHLQAMQGSAVRSGMPTTRPSFEPAMWRPAGPCTEDGGQTGAVPPDNSVEF